MRHDKRQDGSAVTRRWRWWINGLPLLVCAIGREALAQGSGPPQGMEALLWIFIGFAALFVVGVSAVLYFVGARVFFGERPPKTSERVSLIVASVLASLLGGVAIMVIFDIR